MNIKDELRLLQEIEDDSKYRFELKELSDGTLDLLIDAYTLNDSTKLDDGVLNSIALDCSFDYEDFKRSYYSSGNLKIKLRT